VMVRAHDPLFAGLNGSDLSTWGVPLAGGLTPTSTGSAEVLLEAVYLPIRSGPTKGYNAKLTTPRGTVATRTAVGSGSLVLTTLPLCADVPKVRAVWGTILLNLGVVVGQREQAQFWEAAAIEEVAVDGNLQEWLCDMEDRNVTRWMHAPPHLLRAEGAHAAGGALVYVGVGRAALFLAVQTVGWEPGNGDALVFRLGAQEIRCEWDATGAVRVTGTGGIHLAEVVVASLPVARSAHNPDVARMGVDQGDAGKGRTLELRLPFTAMPREAKALQEGKLNLGVTLVAVSGQRETVRVSRPPMPVLTPGQ